MTNGTTYEDRWSLEKVVEETRKGLRELAPPGEFLVDEEPDLSYITQELVDSYWSQAQAKDEAAVRKQLVAAGNVACYWGNNWVHISGNEWAYTNSHSGDGCDPAREAVLCGSGHRWRVRVNKTSARHCRNGAVNPYMAWP